jgi:nucleotide-binding universal stress UspA family protein/deoxyinosine 3'endonuclease (endonuclease V)
MTEPFACLDAHYTDSAASAACILFQAWDAPAPLQVLALRQDPAQAYEPGAFYKRELPLLLAVLDRLERPPGTVIVDGYVWLDDSGSRPGLGARLHRALGERIPVIGVAKTRFAGASAGIPVLRGGSGRPLYLTAAGIDPSEAARGVAAMHGDHRIPTLLQLADRTARDASDRRALALRAPAGRRSCGTLTLVKAPAGNLASMDRREEFGADPEKGRKEQDMAAPCWMQGPPKAILLATDLSARCDRAFDRAVSLATEWQARLVALHVMEEEAPGTLASGEPVPSWRRTQDPQQVAEARIRSELRETAPSLTVVLEKGDAAEAVLRTAEAYDCGLIVTGVGRDELLGRLALGSTVARLVRRSPVPVLVVRGRGHRPYAHVVVATDFSDSSRHALEAAVRFFPHQALTIFNAYDAPMAGLVPDAAAFQAQFRTGALEDSEAFLRSADLGQWQGGKPRVLIEYGEPDRILYDYVREENVDLVALGTHGRSALFEVLIGGVAQRLLATLPCDTLVVREPRAQAE